MELDGIVSTRFVHHTLYGKQVIVAARAVELQNDAPLLVAKDPDTGCATCITRENTQRLIAFDRYIHDELDWAELEFALGALNHLHVVRGPAESHPTVVKVGDLALKRTY